MATEIRPIPSDLSDRMLTINLTLAEPDAVYLRSCEVVARAFRNRVSFSDSRQMRDVLVPRLAQAIAHRLRDLPAGAQVLSLPDFLIELPGLALCGMHIMVMEAKDGVRNAILRFKDFMGAVNRAFRMEIGFHEPCTSYGERLAINVLADVCLPILNLCHSLETLAEGLERNRARHIADRAREFEFQTELLKRFIFNASSGNPDAAPPYLKSDIDHEQLSLRRYS